MKPAALETTRASAASNTRNFWLANTSERSVRVLIYEEAATMPHVADYSILIDEWWTEAFSSTPIEFTIPNNINRIPGPSSDSNSVIGMRTR